MLILALKIGQRLYISPAIGNRLIVEVVDIISNCFDEIRVRLEIKIDLAKKDRQSLSVKCSQQVQASPAEQGMQEVFND